MPLSFHDLEEPQQAKLIRQFLKRTELAGPDDCWTWRGSFFTSGYGRLKSQGRTWRAHRLSYEIHHRRIPDGQIIMHACDNPACVNPAHLSCGTHADNATDKVRKGRHPHGDEHHSRRRPETVARGQQHGRTDLRAADIEHIRDLAWQGYSDAEIAAQFEISTSEAHRIVKGRLWSHLNDQYPPYTVDRHVRGEAIQTAKINLETARLILTLGQKGWSNRKIADAVEQDIRLIRRLVQRKTWRHAQPFSNAESMAFRRACAKFGLGLHLYEKED